MIDWPDTHCAMRALQPALPPDGCAMISRSVGHSARLVFLPRLAGRSTPMTGIDRSSLAGRTFLFLFVLLAAPMAARSATLEDSARELARKMAAALPALGNITCEIRNVSSLQPDEVARIEQTLKTELQDRCVHTQTSGSETDSIVVMLSENLKDLVWTAEIHQGDASRIVLVTVPWPAENRIPFNRMPVALRSEKFWEGSQRILDVTIANSSNGDALLLLLTSDGLLIRKVGSDEASIVQIPPSQFVIRDPAGTITQTENRITVSFVAQICSIDPDARAVIECHLADGPVRGRVYEKLELALPGPTHVERGGQIATIRNICKNGQLSLASGRGDYTEPDTIQAFEATVVNGMIVEKALSDFLHFAGPVMALQSDDTTARAIVRNLQTKNYEAYRILISCGQ